jgi:hypothetical protein
LLLTKIKHSLAYRSSDVQSSADTAKSILYACMLQQREGKNVRKSRWQKSLTLRNQTCQKPSHRDTQHVQNLVQKSIIQKSMIQSSSLCSFLSLCTCFALVNPKMH